MTDINSTETGTDINGTSKVLCEVCSGENPKYKCPKCSIRTCSLECVKKHKSDIDCDGIRSKTHFVSLSQFDENQLMSDFSFLSEITRTADNAIRENAVLPGPTTCVSKRRSKRPNNQPRLQYRQSLLAKHARSRNTIVKFMSPGMERHEQNKSYYCNRSREIQWTIEFKFPTCSDYRIQIHKVSENSTPLSNLNTFLDPTQPHLRHLLKLSEFPLSDRSPAINFYLLSPYMTGSARKVCKLDPELTWNQVLEGTTLLEFPIVIVSEVGLDELDAGDKSAETTSDRQISPYVIVSKGDYNTSKHSDKCDPTEEGMEDEMEGSDEGEDQLQK